ncbi:hypothetical protein BDV93DRAFT_578913 [Ceratobasidium sp. AG-I]|nr:hypothetical protein BDV93DRAFT_578913 [Ceratobasidium sp. AG-I]
MPSGLALSPPHNLNPMYCQGVGEVLSPVLLAHSKASFKDPISPIKNLESIIPDWALIILGSMWRASPNPAYLRLMFLGFAPCLNLVTINMALGKGISTSGLRSEDNEAIYCCISCHFLWYCSAACQRLDRDAHRELCSLLAGPPSGEQTQPPTPPRVPTSHETRPATNQLSHSVRALILPVDNTRPYHADIELHGVVDSTGSVRWDPRLDHILGESSTSNNSIVTRGVGERVLRFPLHIFFQASPESMSDANEPNRNACVQALTGGTPHPWRGDIVVLRSPPRWVIIYGNTNLTSLESTVAAFSALANPTLSCLLALWFHASPIKLCVPWSLLLDSPLCDFRPKSGNGGNGGLGAWVHGCMGAAVQVNSTLSSSEKIPGQGPDFGEARASVSTVTRNGSSL